MSSRTRSPGFGNDGTLGWTRLEIIRQTRAFMSADKTMDVRADNGADAEPGSRWLTHRQLAELRSISTASAIKLALRHGWRKQKDNRGLVRCLVPPEWTSSKRDMQADPSADERADAGADVGADKSSEVSLLRSVYETALEATTARVDALGGQIDALKGEIAAQAALIEGFKGQRQGLLAADARADRAEAAVAGERARADALRDQLGVAQEELRRAREAADQVRQHAREAEDAVQTLRQANAERNARGRWARLRAAWRRE